MSSPYDIAGGKVRRNIAEGGPGVPLTLRLGVVEASKCKPIRGRGSSIVMGVHTS